MNKKNKIVLSLMLGVAMNQVFAEEGTQNKNLPDKTTTTTQKDPKTLAKEALTQAQADLDKAVNERKQNQDELATLKEKLKKNGLPDDEIKKNVDIVSNIEAGKKIDATIESAAKARDEAWKNVHTIKAAALKWVTRIALGSFLIEQFSLKGNVAKIAKYGSAATFAGVCAIAVYKGYNYLFTEEINADEEEF